MRFLIDMPLSPRLVVWLAGQGHDAVHALDVGLDRASDAVIVRYAQDEGQVVVTADLDYPRLLALTKAGGPGVILFRGGNYGEQEAVERLKRVFETISREELLTSIVTVERGRIRRRPLPIERP